MVTRRGTFVGLALLILTSLLLTPFPAASVAAAPTAAAISEVETNDTSGTAQALAQIGRNAPVNAAINAPGDVDWYAFEVVAGRRYVVELFEVSSSLETVGGYNCRSSRRYGVYPAVYDSSSNRIEYTCENNAGGTVQTALPFTASGSGTFYVMVEAHASSVAGSYRLRILPRHDEPGADWDSTTFEPNNQPYNAYPIAAGWQNALDSTIDPHNTSYYTEHADVDYYRLELVSGRTYAIELFNVSSSLSAVGGYNCYSSRRSGLWLSILDPALNEVEENCNNNAGAQVQTRVVFTANTSGTYYIQVMPHSDTVAGDYSIRVLPRYDEPGAGWDSLTFEPNNTTSNAYSILPGAKNALRSSIESRPRLYAIPEADQDVYRFETIVNQRYVVELFGVDSSLSAASGYNCYSSRRSGLAMWLYNQNGQQISKECDTSTTNEVHNSIEFTAGYTGVHFISLWPNSNDVAGNYSVRVRPLFCDTASGITREDCEALVSLYMTTDGPNWYNHDDWLQTSTPCSWEGVECDNGRVSRLDLSYNNLDGLLSSELTHLSSLRELWLNGNPDLYGALPTSLQTITGIKTFLFDQTDVCEPPLDEFQIWLDNIPNASRTDTCELELDLAKSVSDTLSGPGGTLTYNITLNITEGARSVALEDSLPTGLSYVAGSATGGAVYNSVANEVRYNGIVSTANPVTISYQARIDRNVAEGTILANVTRAESGDIVLEESTTTVVGSSRIFNTLVLIYYGADNDLADDGMDVLNNAERAANNPDAIVLMMLDGPSNDDARLYRVQHDAQNDPTCPSYENPTCSGRYVLGQTMWEWPDATADPTTLAEFIKGALLAYPNADQVVLAMIGHGSGISAQGLADQPRGKNRRFDPLAGLLLDDNPAGTSISTRGLGDALREGLASAQNEGVSRTQLDGIYLDACLMGMAEVAYEIKDSVAYMLASSNLKWAVSRYDQHINKIDGQRTVREILEEWQQNEAKILRETGDHPYTYAVIDLSQMDNLQAALDNLGDALGRSLPTDASLVRAAFDASDFFDEDGNSEIQKGIDTYVDLGSFVQQIKAQFADNGRVQSAARSLEAALNNAVVSKTSRNGNPWYNPDYKWEWNVMSGLSIYMPLATNEWQRRYYTERHFQWAEDGQWDEFLSAYWGGEEPTEEPGDEQPLGRGPLCDPQKDKCPTDGGGTDGGGTDGGGTDGGGTDGGGTDGGDTDGGGTDGNDTTKAYLPMIRR